jgi:uncharacterized protein (DUF58 family)
MSSSLQKALHDKILKEVKTVEFSVRKIMSGISLGVKASTFRGQGMTFSDVRAYAPGDDIRNFAWQVMAKTGEPFVKEFEEERDLEVHVAVDAGPSMCFGGAFKSKMAIQAYVLTFLGLSTVKSRDKFGGLIFSSGPPKRLPVLRGEDNVRRALFSYLEEVHTSRKTKSSDPDAALNYFLKLRSKNTICVLVSDFAKPVNRKLLARLKRKHEVYVVFISDPYELEFPEVGFLNALSPKNLGKFIFMRGSKTANAKLSQSFVKRKNSIEQICKSYGIAFVHQSTEDEGLRALTKMMKLRSVYG